ncbi:hypothetical protein ACFXO9_25785 [Nocardia tengchongensis]|uniref:hypothetical protein n=1 Tax=Nocardia tengchongensis TaxID=2055889 RepID=UPI0036737FD0
MTQTRASGVSNESLDWSSYPLLDALRNRRSRRFGTGMRIDSGPLAYASKHVPQPLTEEEQAILVFAAGGITGPALDDWDWGKGNGGNVMAGLVGRTASSSNGIQSISVVMIDDYGTYLMRKPSDLDEQETRELIDLINRGEFADAMRRTRVQISDGRSAPPVGSPYNLTGNKWSLHTPGGTYFLLVADTSFLLINTLLELLNEEMAIFALDERRLWFPAGIGRFAKSKGGHLDDDPRNLKALPIGLGERLIAETVAVEQGMMLQNLSLVCQALGLGGFPHFTGHDTVWFEALGFRMAEQRISRYFHLPKPAAWWLRARGKDAPIKYPVGLERDGTVLLKPYCPPYYPSMEAAVRAVVDRKFGPEGIYRSGVTQSGWRDPQAVAAELPTISESAIEATVTCCEYLYRRYGRFPTTLPPFHTLMGFQAVHLDLDFYDELYHPGVVTDTHRHHNELWHSQ